MEYEDISNLRFGRLIAIKPTKINNKRLWECICDCGNMCYYTISALKRGNNSSCGCIVKEKQHGDSKTRLYNIWSNMKERCGNPNNTFYYNYGKKGIKVCDEWEFNYKEFKKWSIENGYTDLLTIDRIDNNKGYYPNNCRWTDYKTQENNTSRNHKLEYKGIIRTMAEWADTIDISYTTLRKRINDGWSIERAIETPNQKSNIRLQYHPSFTIGKQGIIYLNTKYGTFTCVKLSKFFNMNSTTINSHIASHLGKSADEVLEFYLKKKNKTIKELLEYYNNN